MNTIKKLQVLLYTRYLSETKVETVRGQTPVWNSKIPGGFIVLKLVVSVYFRSNTNGEES